MSTYVLLCCMLIVMLLTFLYWRRSDDAIDGQKERVLFAQHMAERDATDLRMWQVDQIAGMTLSEFLTCLQVELGWPTALFLPTDPCRFVFNECDGYGYGVSDLILEIGRRAHITITIDDCVKMTQDDRTLAEFVDLLELKYKKNH
jgi:hypothetical protein